MFYFKRAFEIQNLVLAMFCMDHIQEKTELLHALISGRQLSTLPKLKQVIAS
jgi:hypothetical protein